MTPRVHCTRFFSESHCNTNHLVINYLLLAQGRNNRRCSESSQTTYLPEYTHYSSSGPQKNPSTFIDGLRGSPRAWRSTLYVPPPQGATPISCSHARLPNTRTCSGACLARKECRLIVLGHVPSSLKCAPGGGLSLSVYSSSLCRNQAQRAHTVFFL